MPGCTDGVAAPRDQVLLVLDLFPLRDKKNSGHNVPADPIVTLAVKILHAFRGINSIKKLTPRPRVRPQRFILGTPSLEPESHTPHNALFG